MADPIFKSPLPVIRSANGATKAAPSSKILLQKDCKSAARSPDKQCENGCGSTAVIFCPTCDMKACEDCSSTIHRLPKFSSHETMDIHLMEDGRSERCDIHNKVLGHFDLFCTTCKTIACATCTALKRSHEGHEVISIKECGSGTEQHLAALEARVQEKEQKWNESCDEDREAIDRAAADLCAQLQQRHDTIVSALHKRKAQMQSVIEKKQKKMHETVYSARGACDPLCSLLDGLRNQVSSSQSAFQIAEARVQAMNFSEAMENFTPSAPDLSTNMLLPGDWSSVPSEEHALDATDCDEVIWDMLLRGLNLPEQNEQGAPSGEQQATEEQAAEAEGADEEKEGSEEEEEREGEEEEREGQLAISHRKHAVAEQLAGALLSEP